MSFTDIFQLVIKFAEAFSEACAKAIENYPFTTFLIFICAIAYLQISKRCVFYENRDFKVNYKIMEILSAAVVFIVAVFVSNFVGFLFNFVTEAIGKMFSLGEAFTRPFEKNPIAFSVIFTCLIGIAFIYFLVKTRGKIRRTNIFAAMATAFLMLFVTYIATSIYAATEVTETAQKN